MTLKKFLKHSLISSLSTGFTLAEVLLGAALTIVVVSAAGFGMAAMLGNNQTANAESEILNEANRATEFMSDEIRAAAKIEINASTALTSASNFSLPSGATPILVLQIPNIPQRIVYYIKSPAPEAIWLGPQVIYRWGPSLDENGNYDANKSTPSQWAYNPLVDLIDGTNSASSCPSGWTSNPSTSTKGFYSCVNSTNKLAELHIKTTVNQSSGKSVTREITTIAFARADSSGGTSSTPKFHVTNKKLTLDVSAPVKFEVLGGAITCGAGGANVPVTTNIYMNGSIIPVSPNLTQSGQNKTWSLPVQPPGTNFTVESIASSVSCGNYYMKVRTDDANTHQVTVLKNGDSVPDITPFDNQTSIDAFLRNYIENGKIKLADNQAIYLFENGANYDPSKASNQQSSAFDMQDNVVLATVDP